MKNGPQERDVLEAAYRYIAVRPHSEAELSRKLKQKGFCSGEIAGAVERLRQFGYLNDGALAGRWAEMLIERRFWGKHKINAYLQQKGIERPVIEAVEQSIWSRYSEEDIARKALDKKYADSACEAPGGRVVSFLRSRGFSSDIIFRIVNSRETTYR